MDLNNTYFINIWRVQPVKCQSRNFVNKKVARYTKNFYLYFLYLDLTVQKRLQNIIKPKTAALKMSIKTLLTQF